ncbi:MAG TPA: FAD-dependent oxidoreductase [Gaiellaceae bacterium]
MKRLYDPTLGGSTEPWWTVEAPPDTAAPPLAESIEAEVAVIGGGFTGLWTALALRARGADVIVLEAGRCGDGASARNGGFLHGYWSSLPRLVDVFGPERALEVARSADGIVPAVRTLEEDVWLTEGGTLLVSTAAAHDARLDRDVAVARELGLPAEAVDLDADQLSVRSPLFRRAIWHRDGGTVQPARLVRALRRAVLASGARLYEHSAVHELADGIARTSAGEVRARDIVVATNAWAVRLPQVAARAAVFRSAIVLTAPVPDLEQRIGWSRGEAISDARTYIHYFRPTRDGRVLMGSASGDIARAERGLRAFFPALDDVPVEYAWEGAIDVSSDRLPFFATVPGSRIHFGAGYTGNGVGPSWLGGQLLAGLALDSGLNSPLVNRNPARLPPEPLKTIGGALVRRALLAVDEAEANGRRAPVASAVAALPRAFGLRVASR